jgi:hypothetical protein
MTTDFAAVLDRVEQEFFAGDRRDALGRLSALTQDAAADPRRAEVLALFVERMDHEHPGFAAYLAVSGGALVETGEPAAALAAAILRPLTRALEHAGRMLAHFQAAGHDPGDGQTRRVSREILDGIAERDAPAVQAWSVMDLWYRPAVATWTREVSALQAAQRDTAFRTALAQLGHTTQTSHWLSLLVETVFAAPFAVRVPELGETWRFVADGVNDIGQLSVLMSDALRDPIARIGGSEPAPAEVLAVMRGDGPQEKKIVYGCSFQLYREQAVDPADGLPKNGRDTWRAPGGMGTHSLPADFLPGTIEPAGGVRTLVLVGPNAPGMIRVVRNIPAVRVFDKLRASLSAVQSTPSSSASNV